MIEIFNADALLHIKTLDDCSVDLIYSDPPYNLGSKVIIKADGKPEFKDAIDFMNKWNGLSGEYLGQWFAEAFRVLKHGGYMLLFSIDRVNFIQKYYANLAGFDENMSMYWYFTSSFPKATDLSKAIDKRFGCEREVVGKAYPRGRENRKAPQQQKGVAFGVDGGKDPMDTITSPSHPLAVKYDGLKYGTASLKQVCEEIMVFHKPCKTGSPLNDVIAYENGDNTITVSALNIEQGRVPTSEHPQGSGHQEHNGATWHLSGEQKKTPNITPESGRYPAQAFIDEQAGKIIDEQSGVAQPTFRNGDKSPHKKGEHPFSFGSRETGFHSKGAGYNDVAGASRILHTCAYEREEYDVFRYAPKVSPSERNAGCEKFEKHSQYENDNRKMLNVVDRPLSINHNNHPTIKPMSLNYRILQLFRLPMIPQHIYIPFSGVASEIIPAMKLGFDKITACEINAEYVEIARARIEYWKHNLLTAELPDGVKATPIQNNPDQLTFNFDNGKDNL